MPYHAFADGDSLAAADINLLMSQSVATFASTGERDANIPAPVAGQMCYVNGIGAQLYIANTWRTTFAEVYTPPVIPSSTYSQYRTGSGGPTYTGNTWCKVKLDSVLNSSGAWTSAASGTGTTFTCVTAGRYRLSGFFQFVGGGQGTRGLSLADNVNYQSNNAGAVWYMQCGSGGADSWGASINGERTFAANDTLAMWVWGATNMAASGTIMLPTLNIRQIL